MSDSENKNATPITIGQKMVDNMYLWIAVGITLPLVFYFAWGVIELLTLGDSPSYNFGVN